MQAQTNYIMSTPDVIVREDGAIAVELIDITSMAPMGEVFNLSHKAAIDLALALVQGVERSISRNQIGNPRWYDSEQIVRRMESPRGKAIQALKAINGA